MWNGTYYASIAKIKDSLPEPSTESGTLLRNFTAGCIGGTLATSFNTPFDVVKSRMQNVGASAAQYQWTWPSLFRIASTEGVPALYRGFVPKILRLGPGGGVMLVVFDFVVKMMS